MARHRDFRVINREDHDLDGDGDDDIFGHSYEDEHQLGVSPATQQMYTYGGQSTISWLIPPVEKNFVINEKEFENQSEEPVAEGASPAAPATDSRPIEIPAPDKPPDPDAPKPQRRPRANRRSRRGGAAQAEAEAEAPRRDEPTARTKEVAELFNIETLTLTSERTGASPNARASPMAIPGGRRQSSPVVRTGTAAGDFALAPAPPPDKGRGSRVAQLATEAQPALPTTPGKSSNSRPGSGSGPSTRTPQGVVASPADSDKKIKAMRAKIEAAFQRRQSTTKPRINLVVVGHVDAGKSTLMGHVLHMIEPTCETRTQRGTAADGRAGGTEEDRPIPFAWNLDETDAERDRGVTIDVAQTCFETEHRSVVLLDAPGHKDFIPNMISGAAQADVALLVVNATRGEFETGFDSGGQTREHAMLVRSLGVQQLLVAVNKMDTVDWSQERYEAVVRKSRPFLKNTVRFTAVQFVPVSGLQGVNLVSGPPSDHPLAKWYSGPALLECVDRMDPPGRQTDKPFRLCVSDFFRMPNSPGVTVAGIVVAGGVLAGSRVLCRPGGSSATVKAISVAAVGASEAAFAGDCCTLVLAGVDTGQLSMGDVVCDPQNPIPCSSLLQARILLLTKDVWIPKGAAMMFHLQNVSETALVTKLICTVDRSSGEPKQKNPRVLNNSCCADVEIRLEKNICMELYKDLKELGRFTLRLAGKSVASGTVTKLYRDDGVTLG